MVLTLTESNLEIIDPKLQAWKLELIRPKYLNEAMLDGIRHWILKI